MRYSVLGAVEVHDGAGVDRTPRGARQRLLLAALLAARGDVVPSDRLVEALWGDDLPSNPTGALQNQMSRLRHRLADGDDSTLATEVEGYRLIVDGADLDAERFEHALRAAEALAVAGDHPRAAAGYEEALALWHGEPYGGLADRTCVAAEVLRLKERHVEAREAYAEVLLALQRWSEAIIAMEALTAEHPMRERPVALLMTALARAGRQPQALACYQDLRRRLGEELGLEPSPALTELEGRILRHDFEPAMPSAPTDARRRTPPPVPAALSSFVGREADLAGVAQRLSGGRLVTICGTGGVGKTRLASEVRLALRDRYPDGNHLVELAGVRPGTGVAVALATAVQVPDRKGATVVERLVEALGGRRVLLVLDNCEHVLDDTARLVEPLLRGTEGLDVLATSRAALGVDGERIWPLLPLGTDGPNAAAVRLFVDRARAAVPHFSLGSEVRAVVEELCRQLDGIPLGIELAAARLRGASLSELATVVQDRRELLAGSRRNAPLRHRSLDALFDWSYRLLDPEQQRLFGALSVFRGPFAVDDVAALTEGTGIATSDVAELVWSLVEQSLVVGHRGPGPARYSLLETLRASAEDRLRADGRLEAWRRRHVDVVLDRAKAADTAMRGSGAGAAFAELDRSLPDLRAAHRHLEQEVDLDGLLRLSESLFWYGFSGIHSEVQRWITSSALLGTGADHPLVPSVMGAAATAAWQRGDLDSARRFALAGIDAAGRLGHPPGSDRAFGALGDVELFAGDARAAHGGFTQARRLAEVTGDVLDVVYAMVGQATASGYSGAVEEAFEVADGALRIAERSGSPVAVAWAAYAAGEVRLENEPDAALARLAQAIEASRVVGERMVLGVARLSEVTLRSRLGIHVDVGAYGELVEHWQRVGAWTQQWTTLRNLIVLLVERGELRPAARLWGAAQSSPTASPIYGFEAQRLEQALATLRRRLGDDLDDEVAVGVHDSDEAAVVVALEVVRRLGS